MEALSATVCLLTIAGWLLLLALQQLQRPPGEEVGRVAMVLVGARLGCGVAIPYQRALLDDVSQGAVVMLGANV